nr:PREDICTED: NACHT, LRR and PYD domains-containing protein 9B-like [Latimeria chalumnae]|eukprot:XP_014348507.1 PREDICTED: NACHT, LRR and PYD domains-containing protein 9B-like [Latimeria chalumnae]
MIKEMFAAFYCAHVVRDDELKECLDAWVRGIIPPSAKSKLLSDVTADHKLLLENFTRLFMGFLSIGNSSSLHDDRGTLKGPIKKNLIEWFQDWLQEDLSSDDFLNLLHYVFELQDSDVAQSVSVYIKNIILFNKPLGAIDVQALCFSLKENKLEKLNLTLCELGDKGMEQLRDIITNCKNVMLSSNKLSEKGGATLSEILQDPKCAIEKLIIGTNHLGPVGAKHLWKALEKNSILKTLHVYDNDIEDEGTATMVESLRKNTTLKELILCANDFSERGVKNIEKLRNSRPDLKVVLKIAEDEDLLIYVEKHVKKLEEEWQQYNPECLRKLLKKIQNDLQKDEAFCTNRTFPKRAEDLKAAIDNFLARISNDSQYDNQAEFTSLPLEPIKDEKRSE